MKILKLVALMIVASLCFGCSKKKAAFPLAGLMIGNGSATCGFYSHEDLGNGLEATLTTNQMDYSEGGHNLLIEWSSEFGRAEDRYEFTLTVDGVTTRKGVTYAGTPITLLETPFKVSVENIDR